MLHALGHAGRAGREVDHAALVSTHWLGRNIASRRGYGLRQILPPYGIVTPVRNEESRLIADKQTVELGNLPAARDHRLRCGEREPILEILRLKHRDRWDGDRSQTEDAEHRKLPLRDTGQHDQDTASPADTSGTQHICKSTTFGIDLGEREAPFFAPVVSPNHGFA